MVATDGQDISVVDGRDKELGLTRKKEVRVSLVLSFRAEKYVAAKVPFLEKGKKKGGKKAEAERIPGCTRGSPSIADEAEIRLRLELEAEP